MEQLEAKVQELENEKFSLKEQLSALHMKNSHLEAELMYYRKAVPASTVAELYSRGMNFVNNLGKPSMAVTTQSLLMVILFSFGLMFPTFISQTNLPSPLTSGISEVGPNRIFQNIQYQPTSQSHDLSEILSNQEFLMHRLLRPRRGASLPVPDSVKADNQNTKFPVEKLDLSLVDATVQTFRDQGMEIGQKSQVTVATQSLRSNDFFPTFLKTNITLMDCPQISSSEVTGGDSQLLFPRLTSIGLDSIDQTEVSSVSYPLHPSTKLPCQQQTPSVEVRCEVADTVVGVKFSKREGLTRVVTVP